MSRPAVLASPVGRFADSLLARELPALDDGRRTATVEFVQRRVDGLPSITRLGVTIVSNGIDIVRRVAGSERMLDVAVGLPLPLVSEYPRLVRSLGFSYVWETWPDTAYDGASS